MNYLGYAVNYKRNGSEMVFAPASVSPELAMANWLKDRCGLPVTTQWTKTEVVKNFGFYAAMQGARVVKVYTEEIDDTGT